MSLLFSRRNVRNHSAPDGGGQPRPAPGNGQPSNVPKRGVLLINLGTPDDCTPAAVRQYLAEFLADPEVITLPRPLAGLTGTLAKLIAFFRCKQSAAAYREIWTERGSPLKFITEDQVAALRKILPKGWDVFYAMRYGNPSIDSVLGEIEAAEVAELVVIPMYPQFAGPTTRTAINEFYRCLPFHNISANIRVCNAWHEDVGYIEAQARLIHDFALKNQLTPQNSFLLFSTHSMPESYIVNGDPYQEHILRTLELVNEKLGWPEERLAISYQSKLGPVKWLTPSTQEMVAELAERGEKQLLVCPISFTVDCLETIEEIGIGYRGEFEQAGRKVFLCPALNDYQPFIECLRSLVLRGPHPIRPKKNNYRCAQTKPLIKSIDNELSRQSRNASLVMVGISRPGRLPAPAGLSQHYLHDPEQFRAAKISQQDLPAVLRELQKQYGFREIFAYNTCCRLEFFGWLAEQSDRQNSRKQAAQVLPQLAEQLFAPMNSPGEKAVNTLCGNAAYRHLLRTACGLNSQLPGETDILDQLETAQRIAQHADTVGTNTQNLMQDVAKFHRLIIGNHQWGEFAESYGAAALRLVANARKIDFNGARKIVAIGGSTTSRSLLHALRECFAVKDSNLSLIYRGCNHGTRTKLLRKAIGAGKRIHVNEYTDPEVNAAIADADIILFGLDRAASLVARDIAAGPRDFAAQPLVLIDFNTLASVEAEVAEIPGITLVTASEIEQMVAAHAEALVESPAFIEAVAEVEHLLAKEIQVAQVPPKAATMVPEQMKLRNCSHAPAAVLARTAVADNNGSRKEYQHESL